MSVRLMRALANLCPGVNCSPGPAGTVATVRWDAPLPEDFEPPTQEKVDAEIARQADPVPQSASRSQLIRVLNHVGKLSEVKAAVAAADDFTQELWLSPTFNRNDPVLLAVAEAVGLTDQLDELFRLSATIE